MTGQCSAEDVFDMRKCLQEHINTLHTMRTQWCRGFGSKEEHVLAMLWWINDQGRNMTDDYDLLRGSDAEPNYDRVQLLVPSSHMHTYDTKMTTSRTMPDVNTQIHKNLVQEEEKEVHSTSAYVVPVGNWSGTSEPSNVFLQTVSMSPFMWGFGHASNLVYKTGYPHTTSATTKCHRVLMSPCHKYEDSKNGGDDGTRLAWSTQTRVFVDNNKWGKAFHAANEIDDTAVGVSETFERKTLRESLLDDAPSSHPFRGASGEDTYGAIADIGRVVDILGSDGRDAASTRRAFNESVPIITVCDGGVSVINPRYITSCTHDPFFASGNVCATTSDSVLTIDGGALGPWNMATVVSSDSMREAFEKRHFASREYPLDLRSKLYECSLKDTGQDIGNEMKYILESNVSTFTKPDLNDLQAFVTTATRHSFHEGMLQTFHESTALPVLLPFGRLQESVHVTGPGKREVAAAHRASLRGARCDAKVRVWNASAVVRRPSRSIRQRAQHEYCPLVGRQGHHDQYALRSV